MLELLMGFGVKGSGGDPTELLYGTLEHGYYGEVEAESFITGDQLATQVGLTAGVSINSDAGWLKFSLDYRTLFVAKKPFRHSITWNELDAIGAVFGTTQITINGKQYKVRLLKGRGDGLSTTISDGFDTLPTHGSEWNRLMYHVSGKPFANASNTLASEGITEGDWAQFSEDELLTNYTYGNGSYSWCQDTIGTARCVRGYYGASLINNVSRTLRTTNCGWRPVLELVE